MPSSRIAIVTGAAKGIGRQIALRLAEDGLDVAVSDLPCQSSLLESLGTEIREKQCRALVTYADVSKEEDVNELVRTVVSELGGLDVMVANAGIAALTPMLDITMDEFDKVYAINVKGTLLCYQAAAKVMIEQGRGGRLIGASSVSGKKGTAFYGSYSASKFAVRALTQTAACEFGRHGITVNAYAPGFIDTDLFRDLAPTLGGLINMDSDVMLKGMTARTALGRLGKPSDIASLISFIASEHSGYITGQSLTIDGGLHFD